MYLMFRNVIGEIRHVFDVQKCNWRDKTCI